MMDRIWEFFVDGMIILFMPLVCSYYTLSTDLFLNVSAQNASGLELAGNTLLAPVQYLLAGKEAIETADGSWDFVQRFDYAEEFWKNTLASTAALPASLILGSLVKGLSFCDKKTRIRHASLMKARKSYTVHSNLDLYRKMGLAIGDPSKAEFLMPEGYQRRPGDENHLAAEKQALKEITSLFNQAGIPWWVDCGTCLGCYRYGGVIPWDSDIDIAVLLPDFKNVIGILSQLDPKKYLVQDWSTRDHPDTFIKVFIRENQTLVDIYHFAILPEKKEIQYILSLESHLFFPEWVKIRERRFKVPAPFDMVFPLKKTTLDGIEVFVPNRTKEYLQRYYGENISPARIYDPKTDRYEKDLTHPYWQRAYVH